MKDNDSAARRMAHRLSRRVFVQTAGAAAATAPFAASSSGAAQGATAGETSGQLTVALSDATGLAVEGPHQFRSVGGWTGLHVTSLKTRAIVQTELHRQPQGTLTLWFSPLEDLAFCPANHSKSKVAFDFPLVSDVFPARAIADARFGLFARADYPSILAKFAAGNLWAALDVGLAPFVYAEKAVLRQGYWYHVALAWDQPARSLAIYVNGMAAGHNIKAENFD